MEITSNILLNHLGINTKYSFKILALVNSEFSETLTFIDDEKYLDEINKNTNIKGVFCTVELESKINNAIIKYTVDDPRYCFFKLQNHLTDLVILNSVFVSKIDKSSHISVKAHVSENNVIIGKNCIIEPNVTILADVEIGDNCIIRAGAVLGVEGFEHKITSKGILSVKHDGKVIIKNNVHIGSCSTIAKGFRYRNTIINDNTKIDNLVHIAHAVIIGENCLLPASCMIAGSVTLQDNVWIGPNASISSQLTVGENSYVTLGSVVTRNVEPNQKVTGNFAVPHITFLENLKRSLK